MRIALPTGTFRLLTPWGIIHRSWADERSVIITYSDGVGNRTVEAVFRFSTSPAAASVPPELRGHSLDPDGYRLHAILQADGTAQIEVTRKS
jgi:hypothetical protein